jgi:anti-sigma regulatory factor (Ser/Thr protein kinase)
VTNFIKYGSHDGTVQHVEFTLTLSPGEVTLQVVDEGDPFDPLQAPAPDFSAPLEDRPKGGLGLHLLRELADRVAYERRGGRNRLTLVTHRV